ncbi:MAG: hypothetical protein ABMA64_22400, partial [Myxococcota bacterium]
MAQEQVPGTRVALTPPPRFVRATRFAGFEDPEREASIAVTEVPVALDAVLADLARERMEARGYHVVAAGAAAGGGWIEVIDGPTTDDPIAKWMLAIGSPDRTALVVATGPAADRALGEEIRAAIATCRYHDGPVSPFDGLPFRLVPAPPLAFAARSGSMVLFTTGGAVGLSPGEVMLTAAALPPDPASDLPTFARDRLTDLAVEGLDERRSDLISCDGGWPAVEIEAHGR